MSFLDPEVAVDKSIAQKRLSKALEIFVSNELISGITAENVELQFKEMCLSNSTNLLFKDFRRKDQRLDTFWTDSIVLNGLEKNTLIYLILLKVFLFFSMEMLHSKEVFRLIKTF